LTLGLVREIAKVGARTDTSGHTAESVEPLLLHKRLDGFEGSLVLANHRSGEIVTVTLWESEEALRATEGASYWLRAFGAEAAGGEVTGLERYEVISSEAWRARP
jgi:heme-degrading monooxygenase HmoA